MRISKVRENGIVEISIIGEIKFSNWERFVQETLDAFEEGAYAVVLDWSEVSYFDSSALQGLVTIHNYLKREKDKKLVLFTDKGTHMHLFELTSFIKLLPIFNSKEEALKCATVSLTEA